MKKHRDGYGTLEERLGLYERTLRLRKLGYSYAKIGGILRVGKGAVISWVKVTKPERVNSYNPDLSPSPDLSYLIGFYLGDGRSAGEQKKVRFKLADKAQMEYINGLVAGLLRRQPKHIGMDGPFYVVDYDSVVLSDYLESSLEELRACVVRFKRDFLRGFFDAEGYASCGVNVRSKSTGAVFVGVANTKIGYLGLVRELLDSLGIRGNLRKTNEKGQLMTIRGGTWARRHDVYHLVIWRKDAVRRFHELVGFQNATKAGKLDDLVALIDMPYGERYAWFTSRYRKEGRKWVRINR